MPASSISLSTRAWSNGTAVVLPGAMFIGLLPVGLAGGLEGPRLL
jgi:hypothetical protein